jgi:Protein of unknown function (DUF3730)
MLQQSSLYDIISNSKLSLAHIQWSLEACMYPIIAISATGNVQATNILEQLTQLSTRSENNSNGEQSLLFYSNREQSLLLSTTGSAIHVLCTVRHDYIAITAACYEAIKQFTSVSTNIDMKADNDQCEATYMLLTPVVLLYSDKQSVPEAQQQCAELMLTCTTALVQAYPLLAVHILPLLLHCLSTWQHTPVLRVKLLYTLPMLGGHKVSAKQIWSVIHVLLTTTPAKDNADSSSSNIQEQQQESAATQSNTGAIGLRMAYKLYTVNSRMLSKLASAIDICYSGNNTSDDDMRLSIAATLYDICTYDAEEGVEYIKQIQQLLQDKLPTIVTLALQVRVVYETYLRCIITKMHHKFLACMYL